MLPGTFQPVGKQGCDNLLLLKDMNPAAGCRQYETVSAEPAGSVQHSRLCSGFDSCGTNQKFTLWLLSAKGGPACREINSDRTSQVRVTGFNKFQARFGAPEQELVLPVCPGKGNIKPCSQLFRL